jgi:hypothetical protein
MGNGQGKPVVFTDEGMCLSEHHLLITRTQNVGRCSCDSLYPLYPYPIKIRAKSCFLVQ